MPKSEGNITMVTPPPQPKRHHYVPRFYLRRFAKSKNPDSLQASEYQITEVRRRDNRRFTTNVNNVAVESGFHLLTSASGISQGSLESNMTEIEGLISETIRRLDEIMAGIHDYPLIFDEFSYKLGLAQHVALLWLRTRFVVDVAQAAAGPSGTFTAELEHRAWMAIGTLMTTTDVTAVDQARLVRWYFSPHIPDRFPQQDTSGNTLEILLSAVKPTADWLANEFTAKIHSRDGLNFITSDAPVLLFDSAGRNLGGVGMSHAYHLMSPLDPGHIIVFSRAATDLFESVKLQDQVQWANHNMMLSSYRSIFHHPDHKPAGVKWTQSQAHRVLFSKTNRPISKPNETWAEIRERDLAWASTSILQALHLPPYGNKAIRVVS